MVEMARNSQRKKVEGVLTPIRRLVLLTQSYLLIEVFRVVLVLGYKVSNLKLVGPYQHSNILFADTIVSCTMFNMRRGGINALSVVKLFICSGIFL